jgi:lycopene beta-cyclase
MDARVAQVDGYRFFYVLPWSEKELVIEDTRYSDSADLDQAKLIAEIEAYADSRAWRIEAVKEVESGVLPIPMWSTRPEAGNPDVPRIGMAGGFFHPVTGYSFPDAVRVADRISRIVELSSEAVADELERYRDERSSQERFFLLLNRMMFRAAKPVERIRVFEHFYALPQSLIERFYAGRLGSLERWRILMGRPPISVKKALRVMFEGGQEVRTMEAR